MCSIIYERSKNHNTNYYRRNKAERFNVKCCPHCNYETTGPKSALQAHIWSKHTPENERPFQCPCGDCNRGFSARANLNKHILKQHNITMPKKIDKDILVYKISLQSRKKICKDNAVNSRINYYKDHEWIINEKLPIKVDNGPTISFDSLYYDEGKNIITVTPYKRNELLNLLK